MKMCTNVARITGRILKHCGKLALAGIHSFPDCECYIHHTSRDKRIIVYSKKIFSQFPVFEFSRRPFALWLAVGHISMTIPVLKATVNA